MFIFKTTTNTYQDIDIIEIDKHQSVDYKIKIYSANSISESTIKISTDGVIIFNTQSGFSSNNGFPLEFTTEFDSYVGKLKTTPTSNNTTFYISKTEYESERYAAHTQSGRKILTDEGISLDKESSLNSLTIRQEGLDYYGNSSPYLVSNIFGPIKVGSDLLVDWSSYNNAEITQANTLQVISSGQKENFIYQKIQVVPGKAYTIYGEGFYSDPAEVVVKETAFPQTGDSFIRVSSQLDKAELVNYQLTSVSTVFDEIFYPDTTEIYVKVGYGSRSTVATLESIQVKEVVPFYTYNQNYGTYYLKWTGLNNIDLAKNNNVLKLDSDNILYNNINIGTQLTTNQLCISYEPDLITVSLNGSNAQEYVINNLNKNYYLELNSSILRFSYMNENLSNTDLKSLSSG